MTYVHVYPRGDVREHVLTGTDCWCEPEVDEEQGIVIHNSGDRREQYEGEQ